MAGERHPNLQVRTGGYEAEGHLMSHAELKLFSSFLNES
jgi:hypothetical protein